MKKRFGSVILALAGIFLVAAAVAGREAPGVFVNDAEERPRRIPGEAAVIRAIFETYAACIERHDADGWMALWDEEGVQLPPDGPMFVGKPSIKVGNYQEFKDTSKKWTMNIQTQEVQVFPAEGYAFARGVYDWTCTPVGGGEVLCYDGKFMTIFRRQADGTWLIYRDIFNSNL
ncbi:MAG TPA: SgcJ/EcaC family oxidoreductase [Spirochaetia bacterium]|nr:SgcJ/EcaC family oxidoreductase [Spirochaetales bacterium]HRY79222.1 SgcJ/EcaC family oxidoreductase [Spirochaetia bacterium]HRZ89086.1 SgcJ/EcaC family oxidoreductase [Spirochaetia bacterium]